MPNANREGQKWGNKKAFDEGWLRIYGVECPMCYGHGYSEEGEPCPCCETYGRVDPRKVKHGTD